MTVLHCHTGLYFRINDVLTSLVQRIQMQLVKTDVNFFIVCYCNKRTSMAYLSQVLGIFFSANWLLPEVVNVLNDFEK